jgi:probable HAF family extracellular repeat protein
MNRKLFHSLAILGLAFSASQSQVSMAQATPDRNGRQHLTGVVHAGHSPAISTTANQGVATNADAMALEFTNQKTYKFRSVDYPGAINTYLDDYDAGTAVGEFFYPEVDEYFYFSGTSYHVLNIPGASGAEVNSINSSHQMAGAYQDSAGHEHGFVYDGKSLTTIDAPGATDTYASEISDSGLIVGFYYNSKGVTRGFLDSNGTFTKINYPHSSTTYANGVNSSGDIVGYYNDSQGFPHGFLLSNGVYSSFDFPGAKGTFAYDINDAGTIAGTYDAGAEHGFTYAGGVFTTVDVPGATSTVLLRIKKNQNVVGYLTDSLDEVHGFIGQ